MLAVGVIFPFLINVISKVFYYICLPIVCVIKFMRFGISSKVNKKLWKIYEGNFGNSGGYWVNDGRK